MPRDMRTQNFPATAHTFGRQSFANAGATISELNTSPHLKVGWGRPRSEHGRTQLRVLDEPESSLFHVLVESAEILEIPTLIANEHMTLRQSHKIRVLSTSGHAFRANGGSRLEMNSLNRWQ
jgi:hypothetical protein